MFFRVGFQDSATPIMEGIVDLHNYIFMYLIFIFFFVFIMFINVIRDFHIYYRDSHDFLFRRDIIDFTEVTHGTILELVWTIIPSVILVFIAVPSFVLLYAMDEVVQPSLTVKVVGHQWYWSYEYCNISDSRDVKFNYDSNMLFEDELLEGELRLLQVDKPLFLPIDTHVRVLVTSYDVLHSWAVPSLGFKIDAVPGRLNQIGLFIKREGVFYGQCSELCGVNHGFMPIMIKSLPFSNWDEWTLSQD